MARRPNIISDPMPACRVRDQWGSHPGQHLGNKIEAQIQAAQRDGVLVRTVVSPGKWHCHLLRLIQTDIPDVPEGL